MKEVVRCAVVGLDSEGYRHAENLASIVKGAELVSVFDPREGKAEQVAIELGVNKWSQHPNDAFYDDMIDAVVIVTPPSTHAEMIKRAAENGKHIFVEKPLQVLSEAEEVIKEIQQHSIICQVGFMRRFDPAYAEAKKRVEAGDIGKPLYFKGVSRDGNIPHERYIKHSCGIFHDIAIHDYDIARYLMSEEVRSITATGNILLQANKFMEKYQDVDQGLSYLTFDSGASGDIETMRVAPYAYDIRGEVVGTEGAIQIGSMRNNDVKLLTKKGSTHDLIQDFPTRFSDAYLLEMIHFIESVQKGEKPLCTEVDGKAALEIAAAATKSFHTGETVHLKMAETAHQ